MSNDLEPGACARCGEDVVFVTNADSGEPIYEDKDGVYVCAFRHGHDEHGVFAPNHDADAARVQRDDTTYFIVTDHQDDCHFDEDADEWVAPNNPFTP